MKKIALLILLICFSKSKAQYITITDANFAAYLRSAIPNAINGNQLDTTNSAVTTLSYIAADTRSITNLNGLQYFDSLTSLDCSNNHLSALPQLPPKLQNLQCSFNELTSLPNLPNSLLLLECSGNILTALPTLPNALYSLYCYSNLLTGLPALPASLQNLYCYKNQLTALPTLPDSLQILYCYNNRLTGLPALPSNLAALFCYNNNITCFPTFPNTFQIGYNGSGIPFSTLNITANPFTCLPNYVDMMDSATRAYPICAMGNVNGCPVVATGISAYNIQPSTFQLYPNPAQNNFTVATSSSDKQTIFVYNINGTQVLTQAINGTTTIDVGNFNNGVYFVQVKTSQGLVTKKIIIQH